MKRREFLSTPAVAAAMTASSAQAQESPRYDTILKGGHVIDLANQINQRMDVAVVGGKIARVDRDIPSSAGKTTVNVAGYYVTPGLIDLHICCYYTRLDLTPSVIADHHCLPSGVTTCCDGGTAGADSFEDFKKIIDRSKMRILSFLNIAAPGAQSGRAEQDPAQFKVQLAADTARKYPKLIVGFKTGHYGGTFSDTRLPWASVDAVVEAGRLTKLPVLADFTPMPAQGKFPATSYREFLLEKMRPGDIVTHCLADRYPFLTADGKLNEDVNKAKARGVKFDLGHAAGSFSFRRVVPALKQGFIPDSISADLFSDTPYTVGINLANVMSKFLCLGVPLEDVIRRTTVFPAQMIQRPELGNLSVGSTADIAVLEIVKGKFAYLGSGGGKITGNQKLQCVLTMFGGRILYDHPYGLSVPLWQDIPKESRYWADTTRQKF
ncbi:MAG: amidohydrolase/deacetylase family metallohydrolase [Bryobacterales bacterium]|nr:amidohydrolase/deacetylase family metallohydrolase [Bryobacterales bacterium]